MTLHYLRVILSGALVLSEAKGECEVEGRFLLAQTVGYFVLLAFAGIATIVLSRPV